MSLEERESRERKRREKGRVERERDGHETEIGSRKGFSRSLASGISLVFSTFMYGFRASSWRW